MGTVHGSIRLVLRQGSIECINGLVPLRGTVRIAAISPALRVVENGEVAVHQLQCHIIVIVVPLMRKEAGGTVGGEDVMDAFAGMVMDARCGVKLEGGEDMVSGMRLDVETIAVDHVNMAHPFGMLAGERVGEQERVEGALLKRDVGVHDHEVLGPPVGGGAPFTLLGSEVSR